MLKATLALHDKVLPPSINFERPNPNLDWTASPFAVNTELRDWDIAADRSRVAGVSAFGFGGTNFHIVMEEYVPDRHATNGHGSSVAVPGRARAGRRAAAARVRASRPCAARSCSARADEAGLANALRTELAEARQGRHLDPTPPAAKRCGPPSGSRSTTPTAPTWWRRRSWRCESCEAGNPSAWPALRARGIHRGSGSPGKVAFLYTGQGSQYANMLAELRRREPVVAELFEEADAHHGAAARGPPPVRPHLRRPGGPGGDGAGGGGAPPHRDPAAGGDHRRHRAHAAAGRVRDRPRHGHGSLRRRVRGPGHRRCALASRTRSRQ